MTALIDLLWSEYFKAIYYRVFMNFVRYFGSTLFFMSFFLGEIEEADFFWAIAGHLNEIMLFVDIAIFSWIEYL